MDQRIQIVISSIKGRLSQELTIGDLAHLANLSPSHLRHLFKAETGLTPAQYIKVARLQHAELLLQTTFLSVKEIMSKVGIVNGSYFSREFKKTYGIAPGKYRLSASGQAYRKEALATRVND